MLNATDFAAARGLSLTPDGLGDETDACDALASFGLGDARRVGTAPEDGSRSLLHPKASDNDKQKKTLPSGTNRLRRAGTAMW